MLLVTCLTCVGLRGDSRRSIWLIALALACFLREGESWRRQQAALQDHLATSDYRTTNPLKTLATLFSASNAAAGWHHAGVPAAGHKLPGSANQRVALHTTSMVLRPKRMSPGPNYERPERIDPERPPGPRDVVVKLYNIGNPQLAQVMTVLCNKKGYWFPKLSISVGGRTWSYDGEPEETYDAIIENASGEPPLRTWNLGATSMSDAEIDAIITEMAEADYTPKEYDFFYRNCNHFCVDLSERLSPAKGWSEEDGAFVIGRVLHESEAIINNMPDFQQKATRAVTWQVQKVIVKAWRKEWKRALAEYEEEQGIPIEQRIGESR